MIIETYMLGNTKIQIADDCKLKSEQERKNQIERFNSAGFKILQNQFVVKGDEKR